MSDKSPLDTIDHVAITVNNIKEAVAWYRQHFKCEIAYQDETWAYLEFANIRLAMVIASEHPSHIGFTVENASKFGVLTTHRDGTKSVYIRDPAGNAVEMVDKATT
jgi:catechol 2,3-dioxygenase-like lactoylglutathione lyase family enzyme